MIRKTVPLLVCAVLASASALGAEFDFTARVTVLPSLSVSTAAVGDAPAPQATLVLSGTQDRCLDVHWLHAASAATAPQTATVRLSDRASETVASIRRPGPAVAILQITLN